MNGCCSIKDKLLRAIAVVPDEYHNSLLTIKRNVKRDIFSTKMIAFVVYNPL